MTCSTAYPLDVYAQRRAQLAAQLGAGGIASSPPRPSASATATTFTCTGTTVTFFT